MPVLLIFFHRHGRFFHLVDVAVNLLERFGVGCPEKLAIGNLRNLSQAGFVKFHPLVLIEQITERVSHRPSMNFRVTSRIASSRVARSPPIVKSLVSIDPDTSSTSIMSIPLASTWVRLLPSCG